MPPLDDTPGPGDPVHDCLPELPYWCPPEHGQPGHDAPTGQGGIGTPLFVEHGQSLPYTGFDVVWLLVVAAVLLAAGVALMRRRAA